MKTMLFLIVISLIVNPISVLAEDKKDSYSLFQGIFEKWTQAFNHKDLNASCDLFSEKIVADYQAIPRKSYTDICDGFGKIFKEKNRHYHYNFKLHEIYRNDNLAAVRITWYLSIFENKQLISKVQDEGLDIFEKDKNGNWKIINYLSYPIVKSK